jgi:hypothetical protein
MKKMILFALIITVSALSANAQTSSKKAVAPKPATQEKVQKALKAKKAKLNLSKVKEAARKESE